MQLLLCSVTKWLCCFPDVLERTCASLTPFEISGAQRDLDSMRLEVESSRVAHEQTEKALFHTQRALAKALSNAGKVEVSVCVSCDRASTFLAIEQVRFHVNVNLNERVSTHNHAHRTGGKSKTMRYTTR